MSEEIDSGTVLGGRYEVGELIVATEEGDRVFAGTDQVLNRTVSILTAAPANATRLAVAAREIAIETRPSPVQVLDLGISQSTTYLIAADADAADLLDLVIESATPYVEPFMTDTLGSEIFGESRSHEPQIYDDDAEYYEELAHEQARKPLFSGFAERLRNRHHKNDEAAGEEHPEITDPDEGRPENLGSPTLPPVDLSSAGTSETEPSGPIASVPTSASDASQESSRNRDADNDVAEDVDIADIPTQATPVVSGGHDGSDDDADTADVDTAENQAASGTAANAGAASTGESREEADARAAREAYERDGDMRPAARFPRQALGSAGAAGAGAAGAGAAGAGAAAGTANASAAHAGGGSAGGAGNRAFEESEPEDNGNKWTRVIVGGVLGLLMIGGVVFAVGNLTNGGNTPTPTASSSEPGSENSKEPSESESASPSEDAKDVEPEIASISRLVPGAQDLNADTDGELPKAIDGSLATSYQTYSYSTPQFGNYAKSMALVLELKESAPVKQIKLEGLNGVGGNMQILVGDTENIDDAKEAYSGSFSGPTLEAGLGKGVEGKYVFVNITELPKIASGGPAGRPYGFTVAEINVK
ncbi:hypothetical protein [Pseudoglutamicibacter cumminsii]|uniref:ABC transporter substrate-binding protein n=1 Tax=Pseudoglutamicibacter cumminsii TaxID=156979 RepID=A0ABX5L9P4_9MICC|nr:hypothetical protein [Pseudoglutamicibacter cumminsii]PWI27985.1 hypothetical protein CAY35_04510 [Pseudoglutamicibacter cumminsii]